MNSQERNETNEKKRKDPKRDDGRDRIPKKAKSLSSDTLSSDKMGCHRSFELAQGFSHVTMVSCLRTNGKARKEERNTRDKAARD